MYTDTILAQDATSITRVRVYQDEGVDALLETLEVTQTIPLSAEALAALQALLPVPAPAETGLVHWAWHPGYAACGVRGDAVRLATLPHRLTCPVCRECYTHTPQGALAQEVRDGSF